MFSVNEVMSASCAIFRQRGFVKKNNLEDRIPNSKMLYNHFFGEEKIEITEKDKNTAQEVVDYLAGLSFKALERDLTDFEKNTLSLISADSITKDNLGIAASLPKVYQNKLEQDAWEERENELSKTSEYVGELRKRCTFALKVENIRYIKSTGAYLYCCSEADKNIVKFFTDEMLGEVNDNINLAGFVKSHSVSKFHSGKETMINRIKLVDDK